MGYIDWRIGGLSCDIDEDFEQFDDDFFYKLLDHINFYLQANVLLLEYLLILSLQNYDLRNAFLLMEEEHEECIV